MKRRRSHWHHDREIMLALNRVTTLRRRASVPLLIWMWWKEVALFTCLALVFITVGETLGLPWVVVGLSALIGAFSPPWSEQLIALAWQFLTPHLLRHGLYHAGVQNRSGKQPLVVRITREPFGERVRLRCPAGTCSEDIYHAVPVLRAACHATDVRVSRDEWRAHMVTVDVIRRNLAVNSHHHGIQEPTPFIKADREHDTGVG